MHDFTRMIMPPVATCGSATLSLSLSLSYFGVWLFKWIWVWIWLLVGCKGSMMAMIIMKSKFVVFGGCDSDLGFKKLYSFIKTMFVLDFYKILTF